MPTLYIDMDGVLVDFNGAAKNILQASDEEYQQALANGRWSPEQWQKLIKVPNLYRSLPQTAVGIEIMKWALKFREDLRIRIYVLTAIPSKNDVPDCIHDKVLWLQQYYPYITARFGPYAKDKQQHCTPGDILIDDRKDTCDSWNDRGGRAIHLTGSGIEAVQKLRAIYEELTNP